MQGRARGRKGERKTYRYIPYRIFIYIYVYHIYIYIHTVYDIILYFASILFLHS